METINIGFKDAAYGVCLFAGLQFVLATWFKSRIEASIKAEYDRLLADYKHELDRHLEDYRNNIKIREQAAKMADFLAFVRWRASTPNGLNADADKEEFDRRAWELSLWLPTEMYEELARCLVEKRDLKSVKELLIKVRKLLLGDKAGNLDPGFLLHSDGLK